MRQEQARPAPRPIRILSYFFMTTLLAAGIAGYILIGRDTPLAGSVPLPKVLETKSPGHDDLLRLGHDLEEIAKDAEQRLGFHNAASAAAATRLRARLQTAHDTGRRLEPRLTREETRVLLALEQSERVIGDYIDASDDSAGDDEQIEIARRQIAAALAHGRGEPVELVILSSFGRHQRHSEGLQDLNEVRQAKLKLIHE